MDYTELIADICGWIGASLIVLAYWMITTNRVTGASQMYQWMNAVGSVGIIVNALYFKAYPSVGLNIIWVGIAIFGLIKNRRLTAGSGSNLSG